MKNANLRAIRQRLPHGALKRIAEETGLTMQIISDFFGKGWRPEYSEAILSSAIGIIRGSVPSDDLVSEMEDLGLTGGSTFIPRKKSKKRASSDDDDDDGSLGLILAAVAGALIMFWPQIKGIIKK